ncbi:MAG TPA: hypothetical protein ENN66_01790 [Proteobacteria bacterium]|nr:hypothetical protein [Pseudomonadota bacterium]
MQLRPNFCRLAAVFALALSLLWQNPLPARAAVANFCWCGFFVSTESNQPELNHQLGKIYQAHLKRYEDPDNGVIIGLLKSLQWDEMTYLGYLGMTQDEPTGALQQLENLDTTYGLFLALEQVLAFAPDESLVHGQPVKTYVGYLFGSLNLFHLQSRNLLSSRPFFVIQQERQPTKTSAMLDLALTELAHRLEDRKNLFTRKMLSDWQEFFGLPGEQRDILRRLSGQLDETFGVAPLCPGCVRVQGTTLNEETANQLKTFIRYYFNATLANHRPVVFLPGFSGQATESVHTLVTANKEGDVVFSEECLGGYGDSGQTRLCLKVPAPKNLVKLSLRCLVEEENHQAEQETFVRSYTSLLDFALFTKGLEAPQVHSLSNTYRQLLTTTRKPSDLYYFNSVINAITQFSPALLAGP